MYQYDHDLSYYWEYQKYLGRQRFLRLRRTCSVQGWTLLVYLGIMYASLFAVTFLDVFIRIVQSIATTGKVDADLTLERILDNSGWGYLLSIGIGVVVLFLWKKPKYVFGTIFRGNQRMKVGGFLQILCIFLSVQLVYLLLATLMELLLNQFGYTSHTDTLYSSDGLGMFLYTVLGAPVAEELLFRGLVLRALEPHGKKFAIVSSALLFGLFHGNISQGLFAFFCGLVLGYVTVEHHILWAMVLHMFNNLVIADSLTRLSNMLPDRIGDLLLWLILGISGMITIASLVLDFKEIREYLKKEKNDPNCARAFWSAKGIIVLIVMMALSILEELSTAFAPL